MDAKIYRLPEVSDVLLGEVSLDHDVVIDADDLQRFIDAGGTIYTRGHHIEMRGTDGKSVAFGGDLILGFAGTDTKAAWSKLADHYRSLAIERADEGAGVQLGCLVLADHCRACEAGELEDGPPLEMVELAEEVVGESLEEMIAAELAKAPARKVVP